MPGDDDSFLTGGPISPDAAQYSAGDAESADAISPGARDDAPAAAEMPETAAAVQPQAERPPGPARDAGGDNSEAILRLLAIVEQIQRATSSRGSGKATSADIITRIERLESWVASNRLP